MNNEQLEQEHGALASEDPYWDVETLVEQVSLDLQGEVNRSVILQVLLKIMPKYENARITTFVPLFARRETVAALRSQLIEPNEPTTVVIDTLGYLQW
jgi:hypothetical protein